MIVPHVLFVCGGTKERDRENSQCKLSSERAIAKGTRHSRSRSVTSFVRKECKAGSTLGLCCVAEVGKAGQGDGGLQSFNLQDLQELNLHYQSV